MSISRAFTTKKAVRKLDISEPMPQRSLTARFPQGLKVKRAEISAPVELVSTTNMLSYNAPDIRARPRPQIAPSTTSSSTASYVGKTNLNDAPKRAASTTSSGSAGSGDDSDRSPFSSTSTPNTSDNSSVESRSPTEPQRNPLSSYFGVPAASKGAVPEIPQRALSHTKKTHEILSRQHSISSLSQPINVASPLTRTGSSSVSHSASASHSSNHSPFSNFSRPVNLPHPAGATSSRPNTSHSAHASHSTNFSHPRQRSRSRNRSSAGIYNATTDSQQLEHPFGNELAQVTELAEEFGISREQALVVDKETEELTSKGLFKFCAEDYMSEIHGLFLLAFGDSNPPRVPMWI